MHLTWSVVIFTVSINSVMHTFYRRIKYQELSIQWHMSTRCGRMWITDSWLTRSKYSRCSRKVHRSVLKRKKKYRHTCPTPFETVPFGTYTSIWAPLPSLKTIPEGLSPPPLPKAVHYCLQFHWISSTVLKLPLFSFSFMPVNNGESQVIPYFIDVMMLEMKPPRKYTQQQQQQILLDLIWLKYVFILDNRK